MQLASVYRIWIDARNSYAANFRKEQLTIYVVTYLQLYSQITVYTVGSYRYTPKVAMQLHSYLLYTLLLQSNHSIQIVIQYINVNSVKFERLQADTRISMRSYYHEILMLTSQLAMYYRAVGNDTFTCVSMNDTVEWRNNVNGGMMLMRSSLL